MAQRSYTGVVVAPYPKVELHVHLEGTVRPATLLHVARRNGVGLPADSVEDLMKLYEFRDFAHFIEVWIATTNVLRSASDFRVVVVEYAAEAAALGAVYIEGIFSPAERAVRGVPWQEIFEGYCDGAQEARERFGVEVRLTPDVTRSFGLELAIETARWAARYRERGVVGLGLGGDEVAFPPEPFAPAFELARAAGLGSVPHAGELAGPASIRGALHALRADRIRHGITAVRDRALLRELANRGVVLDVTPRANVCTGAVKSLADHPLRELLAAGVRCSIGTDDPAMFGTDLRLDHEAAQALGHSPRAMYEAGVAGALCDEATKHRLAAVAESYDWSGLADEAR